MDQASNPIREQLGAAIVGMPLWDPWVLLAWQVGIVARRVDSCGPLKTFVSHQPA